MHVRQTSRAARTSLTKGRGSLRKLGGEVTRDAGRGGDEDPERCGTLSISQDLAGTIGPSRSSSVFDPSSIRPRNVSFADETVGLAAAVDKVRATRYQRAYREPISTPCSRDLALALGGTLQSRTPRACPGSPRSGQASVASHVPPLPQGLAADWGERLGEYQRGLARSGMFGDKGGKSFFFLSRGALVPAPRPVWGLNECRGLQGWPAGEGLAREIDAQGVGDEWKRPELGINMDTDHSSSQSCSNGRYMVGYFVGLVGYSLGTGNANGQPRSYLAFLVLPRIWRLRPK